MKSAGDRFGHCPLFKSRMFAQPIYLTFIYHAILRKPSVFRTPIADHIFTEMYLPVSAKIAGPAIAVRGNAHPVPHMESLYL